MARKYARDNRGRFASKGAGATARGSRLKTAGGNKRDGQTIQAKGGPKGTIGKPKGLKPGAKRSKLNELKKLGASKPVVDGLQIMGGKAINRVATANRLGQLQKQGKLNSLNAAQSRRAQSIFNDAQRKINVAPRVAVEKYKRDLAIKTDKMRRATTAVPGSAKNSAALVAKSIKASSIQRSEAASAKRTFGVRSTISNPGRRSMNLPRQASSTGARVAVSGRTKKQAGLAQSARINRFMDANRVGKGTFKRAVTRQPNILTGRVDRVAQGKLRPGPKRRRKSS